MSLTRRWSSGLIRTRPISSELIRLECLRTIDRARLRYRLSDDLVSEQRAAVLEQLEGFDLISFSAEMLERAADPFPTLLGSLDAVHLTSAVLARTQVPELRLATHDSELARAARGLGFDVLGDR